MHSLNVKRIFIQLFRALPVLFTAHFFIQSLFFLRNCSSAINSPDHAVFKKNENLEKKGTDLYNLKAIIYLSFFLPLVNKKIRVAY